MKMMMPDYVRRIITTLETAGYEAYAVGGCVRDTVMKRRPSDWDIAASAPPEKTMELFRRAVSTGLKHGTVTVLMRGGRAEVTTFRSDGGYSDGRRPDSVEFIGRLEEDLARRDFTMNAMAMDISGRVIDCYGGLRDIERRVIRCVGQPEKRFEEDALRMLRAFRFSAQLGFALDGELLRAVGLCAGKTVKLSAERVRDELNKILMSNRPRIVADVVEYGLVNRFLDACKPIGDAAAIGRLPKSEMERWSAFSFLLTDAGTLESCGEFLKQLRLDGKTVKNASTGAELAGSELPKDGAGWKRLLSDHGVQAVCCAASCAAVSGRAGCRRELGRVLRSGECFSLKFLAVDGDVLASRLEVSEGELVGNLLKSLLDHVIEHPGDNEAEILLELAKTKLDLSII